METAGPSAHILREKPEETLRFPVRDLLTLKKGPFRTETSPNMSWRNNHARTQWKAIWPKDALSRTYRKSDDDSDDESVATEVIPQDPFRNDHIQDENEQLQQAIANSLDGTYYHGSR